jgi:hypothetical protein
VAISQPNPVIDAGYSGKRTAEIVGITYRQLDYWARTDLVRPSLATPDRQRQPPAVQRTGTCSS